MVQNLWDGKIQGCDKYIPKCLCCNLHNNYLVILPNELENTNKNISHLKIVEETTFGGKIAICTKQCTSDDLKPLDCKTFPYFPTVVDNEITLTLSKKCPLTEVELHEHKNKVLEIWCEVLKDRQIREWVKSVKMPEFYEFCLIEN